MATLYQLTQFTIPSSGLTFPLGPGLDFWLSVAVDPITGQSTGTNIVVTITGKRGREVLQVNYGAPALKRRFNARLVTITGTGAIIEFWMAQEEVTVTPQILPATAAVDVNVSNQVDVNLKQIAEVDVPTVAGGIPIESGSGSGDLAGVSAAGQLSSEPTGGDLTSGGLKTNQLPAVLDTGALQVAIEKPLYKPGVVDVHDTGA